MASCSSSLALSRGLYPFSSLCAAKLHSIPQAVSFGNPLGLQWRKSKTVVACSEDFSNGAVIDVEISKSAPAVQPKRKRGRPKKVKPVSSSPDGEEEQEWDFFGELANQIENGALAEEDPNVEVASQSATGAANEASSVESSGLDGNIPEALASASSIGEEQILSEEEGTDDHDDVDYDDPKYQQKPDWMQDAVWESINNQAAGDNDEGQALWVEEDDPNWPAEEPEDGWGFRTSQFFDKVSITNDKADGDEGDDDEDLRLNWENEADDWMIKEITSNEWESTVFGNPGPLVVYVFARYGRRGLDSWKTLEQLENAVTKVWESNKAPLRAVKVDVGMEIDLGSALGISKDECPQLLFIKNGKGLYSLKEQRTSEELVQLMAHFFYNGAKPACLKTTSSPENIGHLG